jgi:hypothetical protein
MPARSSTSFTIWIHSGQHLLVAKALQLAQQSLERPTLRCLATDLLIDMEEEEEEERGCLAAERLRHELIDPQRPSSWRWTQRCAGAKEGYSSMVLATVQRQAARLEAHQKEIASLRARVARLASRRPRHLE